MPTKPNEHDTIIRLIDAISPTNPKRKQDITNLKAMVDLSLSLTEQDRLQLQIRLFYLGLQDQRIRILREDDTLPD